MTPLQSRTIDDADVGCYNSSEFEVQKTEVMARDTNGGEHGSKLGAFDLAAANCILCLAYAARDFTSEVVDVHFDLSTYHVLMSLHTENPVRMR
jgi:hypothetical protein